MPLCGVGRSSQWHGRRKADRYGRPRPTTPHPAQGLRRCGALASSMRAHAACVRLPVAPTSRSMPEGMWSTLLCRQVRPRSWWSTLLCRQVRPRSWWSTLLCPWSGEPISAAVHAHWNSVDPSQLDQINDSDRTRP